MSAHEDGGAAMRAAFEAWISRPPFEKDIARFSDLDTWPGAYTSYSVHLAWDAWQAAWIAARKEPAGDGREAEAALRRVVELINRYLPPDGISMDSAMNVRRARAALSRASGSEGDR